MDIAFLVLSYCLFIIAFGVGACWLWPDYVDSHDFVQVRGKLLQAWVLEMCFELVIWYSGCVKSLCFVAIIVANVWGMLDAFLRYPVVHDIDTLFGLKQLFLILIKLIAYTAGFVNIAKDVGLFVLLLLSSTCVLPIVWLVSLPIVDVGSHFGHSVEDVDLAVRLYRLASRPAQRVKLASDLKLFLRRSAVKVVRFAPFVKSLVIAIDPSLTWTLRGAPSI